jgi:hypothetical protein
VTCSQDASNKVTYESRRSLAFRVRRGDEVHRVLEVRGCRWCGHAESDPEEKWRGVSALKIGRVILCRWTRMAMIPRVPGSAMYGAARVAGLAVRQHLVDQSVHINVPSRDDIAFQCHSQLLFTASHPKGVVVGGESEERRAVDEHATRAGPSELEVVLDVDAASSSLLAFCGPIPHVDLVLHAPMPLDLSTMQLTSHFHRIDNQPQSDLYPVSDYALYDVPHA